MRDMPLENLSPNPYLKFATVAICLADTLEANRQESKAYKVLTDVVELHKKLSSTAGEMTCTFEIS